MSNIERLKQKMKDEYAKNVDQYFLQYEELKESGKFDIDGVEMLLGNGIAAAKEVLISTSEEIMKSKLDFESNIGSKKKHVLPVEKH